MSSLPHGWAEARLEDLAEEVTGSIPPDPSSDYELYSVPAFPTGRPESVDGASIGSNKRPVSPNDVLLCKINPRINRVWLVGPFKGPRQLASTEFIPLRLFSRNATTARYLMWYLRSPKFRDWIKLNAEGATGSHTRAKSPAIMRQRIPVAPTTEQERIVAAIEERFSRLDAGVSALLRVRLNLQQLRAAVLDKAIQGATDCGAKRKMLADLVEPGRKTAYGVLVPGDNFPGGVPLVRIGDLEKRQVRESELKRIDPTISARFPRTVLKGGEVLLSLVGTIGKAAVAPKSLAGANTARAIGVIPVGSNVDPDYVAIALSRRSVTRELTGLSHEVARKTLNLEDVRRYAVPIPSRDRQRTIVQQVQARELSMDHADAVVGNQIVRADRLRASILAAAFSGRLVAQDIANEPASILLERIAGERAATNGRTPRRVRRPQTTRTKVNE